MTMRWRGRARAAGLAAVAATALAACDGRSGLESLFAPPAAAPAADAPAAPPEAGPQPPAVPPGAVEVAPSPSPSPSPGGRPSPAIGGESAWSGALSAAASDMRVTAKTPREWDILWQLIGRQPPGPLPEGAMAVAVLLDTRPTAGHRVDIVSFQRDPARMVVQWRETTPASDALVGQMVTAPWTVQLVERSPRRVVYRPTG